MSRSARGARHLARVFRHVGHPSYLTFFHVSHVAPRVQTTRALAVSGVSARHVAHVAHVENSTCARRLEHHVGHVAAHIPPHSVPSKSPFWRGAPFSPPPISSHQALVPHVGRGLPDTSRHLGHVGIGIFKQRIFSLSCLRTQLWLQDVNAQALCCLVGAQPLFWFSSSNLRGLAPWDIPIRCVSAGTADGGAFLLFSVFAGPSTSDDCVHPDAATFS